MPSLFRFLFVVGSIAAVVFGGLLLAGQLYEPVQKEETKVVPNVKILKE